MEGLVLLGFVHDRCEPCRELRPQLQELAGQAGGRCRVEIVDADRDPEAVARYGVTEFPTLVFLWQGKEVRRLHAGALPASTLELLQRPSAGTRGISDAWWAPIAGPQRSA